MTAVKNGLLIAFDNAFNREPIPGMTQVEHNILMAIIGKLMNKKTNEVHIDIKELSKQSGLSYPTTNEIIENTYSLWDRLSQISYHMYAESEDGRAIEGKLHLFTSFIVRDNEDGDDKELIVGINPQLSYFVNDFKSGTYTSIRQDKFLGTRNVYGKRLFRLLAQWKSTGMYVVTIEELRRLLMVPESYNQGKFSERCLKPAVKSCGISFGNLTFTPIKNGRNIVRYKFTFDSEVTSKEERIAIENVVDPSDPDASNKRVDGDSNDTKKNAINKRKKTNKKSSPTIRSDEELLSAPAGTKFTEAEQRRLIGLRQQ